MSNGYLYVLVNAGMPGLVKVGKTTRDPANRVNELSSATGVPSAFILVYSAEVSDCHAAEAWAHAQLESRGYRPNSAREFFTAPVQEAIDTVIAARTTFSCSLGAIASSRGEEDIVVPPAYDSNKVIEAQNLYELAMTYLHGSDSVLMDGARAQRLFEQSASLGNASSAYMAALSYQFGSDGVRADLRKALTLHQKAVGLGNWTSYSSIAAIFSKAKQPTASQKHWVRFFEAAREAVDAASEPWKRDFEMGRAGSSGRHYIQCLIDGDIKDSVPLDHVRFFQEAITDAIEKSIEKALDQSMADYYRDQRKFLRKLLEGA